MQSNHRPDRHSMPECCKALSLFNSTQILGIPIWKTQGKKLAVVFIVLIVLIGTRCLNEAIGFSFDYGRVSFFVTGLKNGAICVTINCTDIVINFKTDRRGGH